MYISLRIVFRHLIIVGALLGIAGCGMRTPGGGASRGTASSGSPAASSTQMPFTRPTSAPSTAELTCASHEEPVTADSVTITLSCTVTGAESDETAFTVYYTAMSPGDQVRTTLAVCNGALTNGRGTCTVTFGVQALDVRSVELLGELLPSHGSLGPQTPVPGP
jgi:hypothetical protein